MNSAVRGKAITATHRARRPELNCLAGKVPAGVEESKLRAAFVTNLKYGRAEFRKQDSGC